MSSDGRDTSAERRRQLVHLSMTAFALALHWLTREQAAWCAVAAVLLTWAVLPALGMSLRRTGGPFVDGVRTYPIAVLGLVLLLPAADAAAAWVILGVGDFASNVVGRRFGKPGLLGRSDRSLAGTISFVLLAAPVALAVRTFVASSALTPDVAVIVLAATCAGALAELLPLPGHLDDNLPIAAAAGLTLALLA